MTWRKSGNSGTTACVEMAWPDSGVAVRDSKNPGGPMLTFDPTALTALVATISAPRSVPSA